MSAFRAAVAAELSFTLYGSMARSIVSLFRRTDSGIARTFDTNWSARWASVMVGGAISVSMRPRMAAIASWAFVENWTAAVLSCLAFSGVQPEKNGSAE